MERQRKLNDTQVEFSQQLKQAGEEREELVKMY